MEVKNTNVKELHSRIHKVWKEVSSSVSANVSHMRVPDIERIKKYIAEIKGYKDFFYALDPMDFPHSADEVYPIELLGDSPKSENPHINELISVLKRLEKEVVRSQSKDLPMGLQPSDAERFDKTIEYLERLVKYVEEEAVGDFPESATRESVPASA